MPSECDHMCNRLMIRLTQTAAHPCRLLSRLLAQDMPGLCAATRHPDVPDECKVFPTAPTSCLVEVRSTAGCSALAWSTCNAGSLRSALTGSPQCA
eukprot:3476342-Amphidinium_carterae.3